MNITVHVLKRTKTNSLGKCLKWLKVLKKIKVKARLSGENIIFSLPDLGPDDAAADEPDGHDEDREADDGADGHRRDRRRPSEAVGELFDQSVLL